jgi:opacity protein-like surface antigen
MSKENRGICLIIGSIACLLILAQVSFAAQVKIRVIVENATIRSGPNLESEVIQEDVAIGTTFDVEKTEEGWYEIKFRNNLGILVTGYIHTMYVEIVSEKAPVKKEEVKKPAEQRKKPAEPPKGKQAKGDFAVMGGFVSGSFLPGSSSYADSWSSGILTSVSESGTISHKIGSPLGLGVSISYLFMGGLGIQARLDYNFTKEFTPEESFSNYNITWSWTTSGPFSREKDWDTTGEISLIPLSLNLIYKVQGGGMIIPYFSAGVTYFTGSIKANTTRGYGFTWESEGYRYIDYIDIPLVVDVSIGEIGFNIGGGLDFLFSRNVALSVEGNYFIGKTIEASWTPVSGTYQGNNFPDNNWNVDAGLVESIVDEVPPLDIKTSFFKIQGGIKIIF